VNDDETIRNEDMVGRVELYCLDKLLESQRFQSRDERWYLMQAWKEKHHLTPDRDNGDYYFLIELYN
jgi:hypothetical protein